MPAGDRLRTRSSKATGTYRLRATMARLLRETRENADLTMAQAADAGGVNRRSWYRYEAGKVAIPSDVLAVFAAHVKVPVTSLYPKVDADVITLDGHRITPCGIAPGGDAAAIAA